MIQIRGSGVINHFYVERTTTTADISFALPEHFIGKYGGRDRVPDLSVFGRGNGKLYGNGQHQHSSSIVLVDYRWP